MFFNPIFLLQRTHNDFLFLFSFIDYAFYMVIIYYADRRCAVFSVVPLLHLFLFCFLSFPLPLKHKGRDKDTFGNRYLEICEQKKAIRQWGH